MRKEYGKLVRDSFVKKLSEQHPNVHKLNIKSNYIFPGENVFNITTNSPAVVGWLIWLPDHQGRDEFTLEIGWSTKGRFPELRRRPSGRATTTRIEFREDEFVCRLYSLWSSTEDFWWGQDQIGGFIAPIEQAQTASSNWQALAVACAHDAVNRFGQYGLPYLEEFFASKQISRV